MKTLIGICTFGNLPFTQLTINSIRATTKAPIDFFVVVGKPDDTATSAWLSREAIAHVMHRENLGFPAALNDLMDYAWRRPGLPHLCMTLKRMSDGPLPFPEPPPLSGYDNLIIAGNDIVAYPGAVDALIEEAARGEWEWICSSQFDAKSLVARYPEAVPQFTGPNLNFEQWTMSEERGAQYYTPLVRPWELHSHEAERLVDHWVGAAEEGRKASGYVQPDCIKDVRNLCLFRRSVFAKIGYADVNFWPGGYFEDNDACTRARKAGVKACGVAHSAYFHFWSRTIHQGEGTTGRQFANNSLFYGMKWGGGFDAEKYDLPFRGSPFGFCEPAKGISFHYGDGRLKIDSRESEHLIIQHWRERQ